MLLIDEIKELRAELERLERQYLNETAPCSNDKCAWWREKATGRCSWSVLLEDCKDYKSESETEEA